MRQDKKRRYSASFLVLGIGVFSLMVLNVCVGVVRIPLADVWESLRGNAIENDTILWSIRMPRAAAAMILGGALALAGYLMQSFFRNPIAGPFVLGISSGAKMTVALVMVFWLGKSSGAEGQRNMSAGGGALGAAGIGNASALIAAAFVGAMLSMGVVLLMSHKVKSASMLVVCGVMIGYICSAVTDLAVTFADEADVANLHNWSKGSFSGMTWENVAVMAAVVAVAFAVVFLMAKPLEAYQLGEAYARNLGVNVRLLRALMVILSSFLAASIVAFAGPISFVGVAAPHLVKRLFKTARPILMIPACFLGGSAFCLFCDLLSRNLLAHTEISISAVTAALGAPVVIWVMIGRKRKRMV